MSQKPHPVLIRLGCAKLLLRKAVGKLELPIVSRVQKSAVLDFLKKSNMGDVDSDQQAKMVAMLQLCDFTEGDKMEIMSVLAPPPPPDPSATKRLPMQRYYPAIFDYFTAEEWSDMQNPSLQTAMDFLISRTIALGGTTSQRNVAQA